ncbi:MAG: hypothetical protein JWO62_1603, partial [Acidimicrobiaceae bacterium]|nr:hypothetical protein [Acidimicrobiaceae bacterium]
IEWLWAVLKGHKFNNGLTSQENMTLWSTVDLGQAIALVSKGLTKTVLAQSRAAGAKT